MVGRSQDGEAHLPVGDALLELGLVSRDQIDSAHEVQRETGERLGEILVGQGVISRLELADALSEHWSSLTKLRAPGVVDAPVEAAAPAQIPAGRAQGACGCGGGVGARLEESIADRDRELTGQFERLSSRLDEVAVLHEQAGSRLEAIAAAQEAGAGGSGRGPSWKGSRASSSGCRRGSTISSASATASLQLGLKDCRHASISSPHCMRRPWRGWRRPQRSRSRLVVVSAGLSSRRSGSVGEVVVAALRARG